MAKYSVTYSCRHDGTEQLFGKMEDRERKLDWYARVGVCPSCYKAKMSQAVEAASVGLPALQGSEKQVAWAAKLRIEMLDRVVGATRDKVRAIFARIEAGEAAKATPEQLEAAIQENEKVLVACDQIERIVNASWWIEHRLDQTNAILSDFVKPGWRRPAVKPVFAPEEV
jgi:hypothetical protein